MVNNRITFSKTIVTIIITIIKNATGTMSSGSESPETASEQNVTTRPCTRRKHRSHVDLTSDVNRVSVRIPPFWPDDPELWFAQIEGQFTISNILSDTTKFYYVTSNLDPQYSKEVKDIIVSPPSSNKYEKLKDQLIKRLSASRERKIQQLLMHEELGNRKPSQFLRHLQSLAGPSVPEDFIQSIWSSRLPNNIQTLIVSQPTSSLDVLADLADRIYDIVSPTLQVATTSRTTSTPGTSTQSMENEIAELKAAVKNLTMQLSRRSRPCDRSSIRNRRRSTSRSDSSYRRYPTCWYHSKYGDKANRCIKPCDFGKSGNARSSR
ncbi:unnamed protein product [Parnassius mnemosyne]|uniref:DUF7041 domain-containing protein n=1 Tax=Parnassius mnemosyne TaxID=213953 RepID=A0AAV1M0Y7_9NEOP